MLCDIHLRVISHVAWRHQAITWTNIVQWDLSEGRSTGESSAMHHIDQLENYLSTIWISQGLKS